MAAPIGLSGGNEIVAYSFRAGVDFTKGRFEDKLEQGDAIDRLG